jgi:signal transduction histidine kinase
MGPRLEVRDDVPASIPTTSRPGSGSPRMRDRLAAVSGDLAITSRPGHPTRVTASIPIPAEQR